MDILYKFVYAVMLISAVSVVGLVLLQHGKGADMGTGFGAGSSGSLFGASGSANFMSRTTGILATVFFLCTLALAYHATNKPVAGGGLMEGVTTVPAKPAAPASGVPLDAAPPAAAKPVVPETPPQSGSGGKASDVPK